MGNQYRVTKYDPLFRNVAGAYTREDWTSRGDIGRSIGGVVLQESAYLKVENSYLFAVEAFVQEDGIEALVLRGLENLANNKLPGFVQSGASLTVDQCVAFARIALRETAWGKLVAPGQAYVHFGYD